MRSDSWKLCPPRRVRGCDAGSRPESTFDRSRGLRYGRQCAVPRLTAALPYARLSALARRNKGQGNARLLLPANRREL